MFQNMKKMDTHNKIRPSWEHAYIYKKIKEKAKFGPFIRPKQLLTELKLVLKVPPTLHYPILKQMEEEGLIKRINHQKYEFTQSEKNTKIKVINQKIETLIKVGRRSRMLKAMEECGLIKKAEGTRYLILKHDCDKKLEAMGNFTFWS